MEQLDPVKTYYEPISETVICEFEGKRHIEYFWDSHGKLTPFETADKKNHYKSGKFKVVEVRYYWWCEGDTKREFSTWKLYCNDKLIESDIYEVLKTKIKVVVGWG